MTNHANRGWRKRWTLNHRKAVHTSGLVVMFRRRKKGLGGFTKWTAHAVNAPQVFEWLETGGDENPQRTIGRWLREALELFNGDHAEE